jgi:nitrogen fixation NifU-like protein
MDREESGLEGRAAGQPVFSEGSWTDGAGVQQGIELKPVSFSAKVIRHGRNPTHLGRMEPSDASASKVGWCGEVMEIYLRFDGDQIAEASFWADGCLSTMACGDMLTSLAQGMSLEDAGAITAEELIAALDGLPFKSHHCAELSVETLREAIATRAGNGRLSSGSKEQ